MQSQDRQFIYSTTQLAGLMRTLSAERLEPYVAAAQHDLRNAILLYEHNTLLSESVYGLVQGVEIAVRNAMHEELSRGLQSDNWYDSLELQHPQRSALADAKVKLRSAGKPLDPGRIVAELSLGFWTGLSGPAYANVLWIPHLHKAFPHKALGRKLAHSRLDRIRKLRNRIAHHEPILSRDLWTDFQEILEVAEWVCPHTSLWIRETTSFAERHRAYISFRQSHLT